VRRHIAPTPSPPPPSPTVSRGGLRAHTTTSWETKDARGNLVIVPADVVGTKPELKQWNRLSNSGGLYDPKAAYIPVVQARASAIAAEFFATYWRGATPPRRFRDTLIDYAAGTIIQHTPLVKRGSDATLVVVPEITPAGYLWWYLGLRKGDTLSAARAR
jgi:hypothetical protein